MKIKSLFFINAFVLSYSFAGNWGYFTNAAEPSSNTTTIVQSERKSASSTITNYSEIGKTKEKLEKEYEDVVQHWKPKPGIDYKALADMLDSPRDQSNDRSKKETESLRRKSVGGKKNK